MELIHGELAPEDFISAMPDIVTTNILDRLPLQDAVRTSVLSSNWRPKWTMLTQLVFDEKLFEYLRKTEGKTIHVRTIISSVLLQHRGAITKFVLGGSDKHYEMDVEHEDISHWILFLSRNGIKDLTFVYGDYCPTLKLPIHLFSCLELKHLKLVKCCFNLPHSFHGFPNLLSLELHVYFGENAQLGEFFTRCPLLEIFKLNDFSSSGKAKLVEIAKLKSLKILSLNLCDLDTKMITSFSTIFELVCSFPKLQELELNFFDCELIEGGANKSFSTAFSALKALKLSSICLENGTKLSCAFVLIRSCPNLQSLEITAANKWGVPDVRDAVSLSHVDYNTTGLLQLQSMMFEYSKGSENEVCLIKYLLVCSPFLKKIVIRPGLLSDLTADEKLAFAMKLLKLHRASTVAEIDLF